MDSSIERINEYRLHTSIENAPVILKRQKALNITGVVYISEFGRSYTL